jgi:hypothetical protein
MNRVMRFTIPSQNRHAAAPRRNPMGFSPAGQAPVIVRPGQSLGISGMSSERESMGLRTTRKSVRAASIPSHRRYVLALAVFWAGIGQAQNIPDRDLTKTQSAAEAALGKGFISRAEPARLDLTCPSCAGSPIIGIQIGRQADGTEERIRSGETKIGDLERLCRARSPECRIEALEVRPAVGWVSSYQLGEIAGATAVVILNGELLTIRSLADSPAHARGNIDRLLPVVRKEVIGR